MKDTIKKIEALKMAHLHQIEMLEQGIHSDIEFHEFEFGWEFEVCYIDDTGTGDAGCTFDEESLEC